MAFGRGATTSAEEDPFVRATVTTEAGASGSPGADEAPKPFRLLPRLTLENRHFWTGGEHDELRFLRCDDCGWWLHPPAPICPRCLSRGLSVSAARGLARVHAFTVNHKQWIPGFDPPYVVAIVELDEQAGLRLTTNIVQCAPEAVHTGQRVRVVFEHREDVWLPLFAPAAGPP
jgi:uncharacterized OB-fold protein